MTLLDVATRLGYGEQEAIETCPGVLFPGERTIMRQSCPNHCAMELGTSYDNIVLNCKACWSRTFVEAPECSVTGAMER